LNDSQVPRPEVLGAVAERVSSEIPTVEVTEFLDLIRRPDLLKSRHQAGLEDSQNGSAHQVPNFQAAVVGWLTAAPLLLATTPAVRLPGHPSGLSEHQPAKPIVRTPAYRSSAHGREPWSLMLSDPVFWAARTVLSTPMWMAPQGSSGIGRECGGEDFRLHQCGGHHHG
jgi:hypothetical protein